MFVSDPTFKVVSAPTPDPATLVSASRMLRGNYTNVLLLKLFREIFSGKKDFYYFNCAFG
jgi:hypothetical protein